ncbi:hypothetical protein Tsubulata_011772 [Turnera subulata]|uniref:Uncharacterized protein n=1 Tax=Turnera subulata TaxID=218843 RepID=A0A9Q0GG86_9ROSI|nr:hypothetical protein Tsubulata_011772 [Turnera subulata]
MAVSFLRGESSYPGMQRPWRSRGVAETPTHLVIVMDGLKEFDIEPLRWALENIWVAGCVNVNLIGAMPWLNIPLSSKTSGDVWGVDFEELAMAKERGDQWRSDSKFLKLQAILDLCQQFGVVPQKEVVMGYPLRLSVVEKITSLYATWVVFDRYQLKKDVEFYAEKVPCNMVMMSENDEPVIIRFRGPRSSEEFTPGRFTGLLVTDSS